MSQALPVGTGQGVAFWGVRAAPPPTLLRQLRRHGPLGERLGEHGPRLGDAARCNRVPDRILVVADGQARRLESPTGFAPEVDADVGV